MAQIARKGIISNHDAHEHGWKDKHGRAERVNVAMKRRAELCPVMSAIRGKQMARKSDWVLDT